ANADKARALVRRAVPMLGKRAASCAKGCHTALENAIITHPDKRSRAMVKKLAAVAGRVLGVQKGRRRAPSARKGSR
ncbi:MAG: hypothetical protein AAB223_12295, partial [Pseudomonadota bacterium]